MFDTTNSSDFDNVVSNDNDSETFEPSELQVVMTLDRLITEREDWEANAYRVSNQQLYAILANCYALDMAITSATDGKNKLRSDVNDYAARMGFKFKNDTPLITRIVRCVFGNVHRSRISTYSLVLREAKRAQVSALEIPAFIEQAGGIQEIRLSKSENYVAPKAKAEIVKQAIEAACIGTVQPADLSAPAEATNEGGMCVLIATQLADGGFQLHAVVRSKEALSAALVGHYKQVGVQTQTECVQEPAVDTDTDELLRIQMIQNILDRA